MKRLSIIIPVYNVEKYIKRCLDSIIQQIDQEQDEIILIDDGSTDNSFEICKEYEQYYKNIKLKKIKNSGPSFARNVRHRTS